MGSLLGLGLGVGRGRHGRGASPIGEARRVAAAHGAGPVRRAPRAAWVPCGVGSAQRGPRAVAAHPAATVGERWRAQRGTRGPAASGTPVRRLCQMAGSESRLRAASSGITGSAGGRSPGGA